MSCSAAPVEAQTIRTVATNAPTMNFTHLIQTRLTRWSPAAAVRYRQRKTARSEGNMSDLLSFTLSAWLPFLTLIVVGYFAIRY